MGQTYLKYLEKIQADIVRALKPLGKAALIEAYKTGHTDALRGDNYTPKGDYKWRHKLGNLHDSFASAVYVNGDLVQSSIQYLDGGTISKKRDPRTKKNGRQTVKDYLKSHSFGGKNNDIVLVVVAAMFYTRYLEDEDSGSGRFIVISPAREFIDRNWWRYVEGVYQKYGLKGKPTAKIIKGETRR